MALRYSSIIFRGYSLAYTITVSNVACPSRAWITCTVVVEMFGSEDAAAVVRDRDSQHGYVMGLRTESQFREPTAVERALLQRLLKAEFPGKSEMGVR